MKKLVSLLILSVSLFTLSACGEKNEPSSTPESEASSGKEMTFSEYFDQSKNKTQIWYRVRADEDGIGKDTGINIAYVFNNNKVTKYDEFEMTLGDVARMDDSKIIKEMKEQTTEHEESKLEENIGNAEETIRNRESNPAEKENIDLFTEQLNSLKDSDIYLPKPSKYKFSIYTDTTGNNTVSEKISFTFRRQELAYLRIDESAEKDTVVETQLVDDDEEITFSGPSVLRGTTIYDAKYITVNTDNDCFLLCRDNKMPPLVFDEPDTKDKNVKVDPKD